MCNIEVITHSFLLGSRHCRHWRSSKHQHSLSTARVPRHKGYASSFLQGRFTDLKIEARDLVQVEFRFYSFVTNKDDVPTTDAWIEFPAAAYEDEKIWHAVVPEHHQILGLTLHPKGCAILGFDL
jgi:hypothetical protein